MVQEARKLTVTWRGAPQRPRPGPPPSAVHRQAPGLPRPSTLHRLPPGSPCRAGRGGGARDAWAEPPLPEATAAEMGGPFRETAGYAQASPAPGTVRLCVRVPPRCPNVLGQSWVTRELGGGTSRNPKLSLPGLLGGGSPDHTAPCLGPVLTSTRVPEPGLRLLLGELAWPGRGRLRGHTHPAAQEQGAGRKHPQTAPRRPGPRWGEDDGVDTGRVTRDLMAADG